MPWSRQGSGWWPPASPTASSTRMNRPPPAIRSMRCSGCSRSWPDQRPGGARPGRLGGPPRREPSVEVAGRVAEFVQQLGGRVSPLPHLAIDEERSGAELRQVMAQVVQRGAGPPRDRARVELGLAPHVEEGPPAVSYT